MDKKTRPASVSLLAPEFDAFLFAPIGEQRNGMLLSVVSALANLDVDPWEEAANLARLPRKTATERLASLIASLPSEPLSHRDPGTIASGLIALLPPRTIPSVPAAATLFSGDRVINTPASGYVIICALLMALALGAQWIAADRLSAGHIERAHVPAAREVVPQTAPVNSAR